MTEPLKCGRVEYWPRGLPQGGPLTKFSQETAEPVDYLGFSLHGMSIGNFSDIYDVYVSARNGLLL